MSEALKIKEIGIQRNILDNLVWRGIFCWRSQATPVPIRRGRAIVGLRKIDPHLVGMPDVMALIHGTFVAIEVKSKTGRQRPEQKEWEARVKKNRGIYILARSWEDVARELDLAGIMIS
jgi:hypothetical protein